MRGGRQPIVERSGITERGGRPETWPGGKVVVRAGLSFRVYFGCSKRRGVRKRPELRQTAARNPRFEREVKFAPYSSCVADRGIPVERDPVRRSNLPSQE